MERARAIMEWLDVEKDIMMVRDELREFFKSVHRSNCLGIMRDKWFSDWGMNFFSNTDRMEAEDYLNFVEWAIIGNALDARKDDYTFDNFHDMYYLEYKEDVSDEDFRTLLHFLGIYDELDNITAVYKEALFDKAELMREWEEENKKSTLTEKAKEEKPSEAPRNIIRHDCGNGITVVMEDYCWLDLDEHIQRHEFVTYLEKDGVVWQDITMVRTDGEKVEALVWEDCDSEDYTCKFKIDIHEED